MNVKFDFESVYKRMLAARDIHRWQREEQELWRKANPQKKAEKKTAEKSPSKNQQ